MLEVAIQNLAAVPSIVYGILGLAFIVRGLGLGRALIAGAIILTLVVLPTVIVASARRSALCPTRSARAPTRSARRSGRSSVARSSRPQCPGSPRDRSSASPAASARLRRCFSSARSRSSRVNPTLSGPYTALPIQIFQWIGRPQDEFKALAAGAIIVLLLMLLTLNAFAILIRNRYQKKW